ncbi:MAG TPA: hypothetical protein PKY59_21550 [Pyrinomonadaceae bacterium]|nr:hypothetical protein [Pyrinomonadaceae bacterium]
MNKIVTKLRKIISNLSVVLILGGSLLTSVSAQEQKISKEEFETAIRNAERKLLKVNYRSITSEMNGKNEKKTIYEVLLPNKKHLLVNGYVYLFNKKKEIVFTPTFDEWIYIAEKVFYRNRKDDKWRLLLPDSMSGIGEGRGSGSGNETPTVTTEYYKTTEQLNNIYEKVVSTKYANSVSPIVDKNKYWIRSDGLFVKTLLTMYGGSTTVEYDYDSVIKIEAPTKIKK